MKLQEKKRTATATRSCLNLKMFQQFEKNHRTWSDRRFTLEESPLNLDNPNLTKW